VFGLGFAIEGFSFFMEAIFIGIYAYGWGRLSPRTHFLSGIPIAFTGFLGSLMVIAVNAWMNHPGGFRLRGGKVVDVDPFKALFANSYLWHELIHMYVAAYVVTGFILAGAYALGKLRGRWGRYQRIALTIPLTVAALASIAEGPIGDWAARDVTSTQPIKLAAMEGLYRTTRGAAEHILGWYSGNQLKFGIPIPHLLSILADHSWNGKVLGLDAVPASQRPPVNVVHWAWQAMLGIGSLLVLLGVVYLAIWLWRKRLPESVWFYRALILAGPAAVGALISGWIVTEVGRQPWVVYRVMPTAAAVTGAHGIPVGYGALAASYVVVACGLGWVLWRLARRPLELAPDQQPAAIAA
jgi:cytochrome d ubiquinol oxidase subunit I